MRIRTISLWGGIMVSMLLLAGCTHAPREFKNIPLNKEAPQDLDIQIPTPVINSDWSQQGGSEDGISPFSAYGNTLKKQWSRSVGSGFGSARNLPQPVIAAQTIFTLDADYRLMAFSLDGKRLWRFDPTLPEESSNDYGGGLLFDNAVIYITTGYGHMLAFDTAEKKLLWDHNFVYPFRSAPVILGNQLFAIQNGNGIVAVNKNTGELMWSHYDLTSNDVRIIGSPVASEKQNIIFVADSAGMVTAYNPLSGQQVWSYNVSSPQGLANLNTSLTLFPDFSLFHDIRSRIVLTDRSVIAVATSGNLVNIVVGSATPLWSKPIGSFNTPLVINNVVYVMDTAKILWALNIDTGSVRWKTQFPTFDNPKKRTDSIVWSTPRFGGGLLWLTSSDGMVVGVDPLYGSIKKKLILGTTLLSPPIFAQNFMFLLTSNGELYKFS